MTLFLNNQFAALNVFYWKACGESKHEFIPLCHVILISFNYATNLIQKQVLLRSQMCISQ